MQLAFPPTRVARVAVSGADSNGVDFGAPSWMPTSDSTFTFMALMRRNGLGSPGAGGRIWSRDSGSFLTHLATDGDARNLRLRLNRGTDLQYNTGTDNPLPDTADLRWFWLAVSVNAALGTNAKISFYTRFLRQATWRKASTTVVSEGSGSGLDYKGNYVIGNGSAGMMPFDLALWLHNSQSTSEGQLNQYFTNDPELYEFGAGGGHRPGSSFGLRAGLVLAVYPGRWGGGPLVSTTIQRNDSPQRALFEYGVAGAGGNWHSYVSPGNLFLEMFGESRPLIAVSAGPAAQNLSFTAPAISVAAAAPSLSLGAVSLAPGAAAVAVAAQAPSVAAGAISLALSEASVAVAAQSPSLAASIALALPEAAVAVVVPAPTLDVAGGPISLSFTPPAVAVVAQAPSVSAGAVSLALGAAGVAVVAPDPGLSVAGGPSYLNVTPAVVACAAQAPSLALGATSFSCSPASCSVSAASPALALGAVSLSLSSAAVAVVAVAPAAQASIGLALGAAAVSLTAPAPVLIAGAASVALSPAAVAVVAWDGTLVGGFQTAYIALLRPALLLSQALAGQLLLARCLDSELRTPQASSGRLET